MNQKASVALIIVVLMISMGAVYFMDGTTPPARETAMTSVASVPENPASGEHIALTPDLTKLDASDAYKLLAPIPEGHKAPDFTAKTAEGKPFSLSSLQGKKNAVLIFYQGSFCGVCAAQLSNIQKHINDFKAQDAEVIAISADDMRHAVQSVGENGLSFPVIPDTGQDIIRKFGVQNLSKGGIAWPSAYVIDKQGIVRLSYADEHGHRLHSSDLLPVLSKITGKPVPKLGYND